MVLKVMNSRSGNKTYCDNKELFSTSRIIKGHPVENI